MPFTDGPATAPARETGQVGPPASAAPTGSQWSQAARIVLLAAAVVVGLWLVVTLQGILLQVLIAIIVSAGLSPLVEWLRGKGVPRPASVLLIYLSFLLALAGLGVVIAPLVAQEVQNLIAQAPVYGDTALRSLQGFQRQFPFLPPLDKAAADQLRNLGNQLGTLTTQAARLIGLALSIVSGVLAAILTLLITFYLLVDGWRIRNFTLSFVPADQRERARNITDRIGHRMGGWLLGQVTLSASIGLASYIGLTILGVNNSVLLAVIAAVGEVVPLIGPIISAIPAVIIAFTQSPVKALLVIALYIVIQQLENNILAPRIMSRAVKLHPLAVVLAILIGGQLLGIVGALVAVPTTTALAVILNEVRPREQVQPSPEKPEAPTDTAEAPKSALTTPSDP